MSKEYLSIPCPACGRRIYLNSHGYQCEACMFHIKNYICNRRIAKHEAESIVMGKRIILDGFSSNAGEVFSSIPVIRGHTVMLDNTVVFLPNHGRIVARARYFVCENSDGRGSFRVQRMYNGHSVTADEVVDLIRHGKVCFESYDEKGNKNISMLLLSGKHMSVSFWDSKKRGDIPRCPHSKET